MIERPCATRSASSSNCPQVTERPVAASDNAILVGSATAASARRSATLVSIQGSLPQPDRPRLANVMASGKTRPVNLKRRSRLAGEAAAANAEVEVALRVEADPDVAAFFDVDNTVMQGASIFHLAKGLHR